MNKLLCDHEVRYFQRNKELPVTSVTHGFFTRDDSFVVSGLLDSEMLIDPDSKKEMANGSMKIMYEQAVVRS